MFMQIVLGKVSDAESMRREWDRWMSDLAPGATGWLGSTGGVTPDGRLLMSTCFASAEAAAGNARRPERVAWWAGIEECLDAPPMIVETEDVTLIGVGDISRAGFVQAMRAGVRDRAGFEAAESRLGPRFVEHRPDFLAGYRLWSGDTTVVALDYFSSEADARGGEAKPMPDDLAAGFQEWQSLLVDTEWYDITDPWLRMPE